MIIAISIIYLSAGTILKLPWQKSKPGSEGLVNAKSEWTPKIITGLNSCFWHFSRNLIQSIVTELCYLPSSWAALGVRKGRNQMGTIRRPLPPTSCTLASVSPQLPEPSAWCCLEPPSTWPVLDGKGVHFSWVSFEPALPWEVISAIYKGLDQAKTCGPQQSIRPAIFITTALRVGFPAASDLLGRHNGCLRAELWKITALPPSPEHPLTSGSTGPMFCLLKGLVSSHCGDPFQPGK